MPSLIIGLAGDSNGMWGKYRLTDGTDNAGSGINQYKQNSTVAVANEPLDNVDYVLDDVGTDGQIGSTVALARLLRDGGYGPTGYDILLVPHFDAGSDFATHWAVDGTRLALNDFLTRMSAAVALEAGNRVWFFDWNEGANDTGRTEAQWQGYMVAMWAEIRATVATALYAPVLVTGIPPNAVNPALGNNTGLGGVIAAQQNVESYLANSKYIDVADITDIDNTDLYKHFTAAAHRGGTNNAPGNTSETYTVANSLAGRKSAAFQTLGYPRRMTWGA